MPKPKQVDNPLPDLPALVVIPTSGFEHPWRGRKDDPEVPESARVDILLAIASLLAMIDLAESFFSNSKKDQPTLQNLGQLRKDLENLENAIIHEHFDSHPTIDTSELASIMDTADVLIETLPGRSSSAGQAALRFFMEEIRRRAFEIFDISIMSISVLDAEKTFNMVNELPYPP